MRQWWVGNCIAARRGGEQPIQDSQAVMKMNHIMSVENYLSEPAEPVPVGEGQRSQPKSNSPADATSDGVFVDGMAGNDTEISREICFGGAKAPTAASSLSAGKSGRAGAEVGAAGSSVDLWDTITHGERSGSACIQATKRSEGLAMAA